MTFIVQPSSNQEPQGSYRVNTVTVRRRPTWLITAVGVLTIIVGLGLLLWPLTAATSVLALMIGAALIFIGIGLLIRMTGSAIRIITGVIFILFGTLALSFPEFTVSVLVSFIGASFIFFGAVWLIIIAKIDQLRNVALMIPPLLLLAGGTIALVWHEFAVTVAAIGLGLITILIGASIIWTARRIKKMSASRTTLIVE